MCPRGYLSLIIVHGRHESEFCPNNSGRSQEEPVGSHHCSIHMVARDHRQARATVAPLVRHGAVFVSAHAPRGIRIRLRRRGSRISIVFSRVQLQ